MINPSFAFWYSFGGAVVMLPVVEPLLWLPALVISRNTPSKITILARNAVWHCACVSLLDGTKTASPAWRVWMPR